MNDSVIEIHFCVKYIK